MPYCPKCKIEFLSGIETCSECGTALMEELPEGEEVLVPDWEVMDEKERALNARKEADQLRNAASTVYVKKADKYEDLHSTAVCFTVLGIIGFVFCFLNLIGVLSIYRDVMQLVPMLIIFAIFTAVGISSYVRSKEVKGQISEEESLTKELTDWMEETVTKEFLDKISDPSVSEEANFLQQAERIKGMIYDEFEIDETSDSYLDTLIDEFFNTHF
jgi:hypothetical protein